NTQSSPRLLSSSGAGSAECNKSSGAMLCMLSSEALESMALRPLPFRSTPHAPRLQIAEPYALVPGLQSGKPPAQGPENEEDRQPHQVSHGQAVAPRVGSPRGQKPGRHAPGRPQIAHQV